MARRYDDRADEPRRDEPVLYHNNTRHVHIKDLSIVPRSKHAIFIRGFHDKITPKEVERAFEEKLGGPLRTVFFKPDYHKKTIHIALRFEDADLAKAAVDNFNRTTMLGCTISVDHYQDIGAYASYLDAKKQADLKATSRERSRSPIRERSDSRPRGFIDKINERERYARKEERTPYSTASSRDDRGRDLPVKDDRDRMGDDRVRGFQSLKDDRDSRSFQPKEERTKAFLPRGGDRDDRERERRSRDAIENYARENLERREQFFNTTNRFDRNDDVVVLSQTNHRHESDETIRRKQLEALERLQQEQMQHQLVNQDMARMQQRIEAPRFVEKQNPLFDVSIPPPGLVSINSKFSSRDQPSFFNSPPTLEQQQRQQYKQGPPGFELQFPQLGINPAAHKLKLGSIAMERSSEIARKERINRLNPEARAQVEGKMQQIDEDYKGDCKTFGFITQLLINKDPALEDRLKLALSEVLNDLSNDYNRKMDDFVNLFSSRQL